MDLQLVFTSSNLLDSSLATFTGEVCYETSTTTPVGRLIPITRIYRHRDPVPLSELDRTANLRDSTVCGGDGEGSLGRQKLAEIHWKETSSSSTLIYSHSLLSFNGVPAHTLLKKRNPLSLSQKCHFFTGNDGVKYRWKVIGRIGCVLTRDGEEVGRCLKKFIAEGTFMGHTKFVLHMKQGSESLDMGMVLFTFLLVDNRRQQKDHGPLKWRKGHDDEGDGEADSGPEAESGEGGH